jgi:hypothetical protein
MTEQQETITSCSKYEVPTLTQVEYLKRGNQTLLDLFDIKEEQIQKMADDLFGNSIELQKPVLKRGVHINEDFGLADPIEQEEEDSDSYSLSNWAKNEEDADAKAQLQEHLLEQQQDDLVWSPFGQCMVTPKDFETFEEPVEPIIKQESVKQEASRQQQEAQNTFYDFADLVDCFEAMEEEEEEEKQEKQEDQTNTNSDPKRNWVKNETKCIQLQENLDLLPDKLSKPTDKRYLQEWQIMEQVWLEEYQRIIIEHTENCVLCQSTPPKKLRRCEECNTIEPIEPIEY